MWLCKHLQSGSITTCVAYLLVRRTVLCSKGVAFTAIQTFLLLLLFHHAVLDRFRSSVSCLYSVHAVIFACHCFHICAVVDSFALQISMHPGSVSSFCSNCFLTALSRIPVTHLLYDLSCICPYSQVLPHSFGAVINSVKCLDFVLHSLIQFESFVYEICFSQIVLLHEA